MALNEWGLVEDDEFARLVSKLRDIGGSIAGPLSRLPDRSVSSGRIPDKSDFANDIAMSLAQNAATGNIAQLVWRGYLSAVLEWTGILTADEYHELNSAIVHDAKEERRELFLGVKRT